MRNTFDIDHKVIVAGKPHLQRWVCDPESMFVTFPSGVCVSVVWNDWGDLAKWMEFAQYKTHAYFDH